MFISKLTMLNYIRNKKNYNQFPNKSKLDLKNIFDMIKQMYNAILLAKRIIECNDMSYVSIFITISYDFYIFEKFDYFFINLSSLIL